MENILSLKGINKSFGRKQVLKGIDLTVNQGEIIGYLGPNGAGKTTTIRIILNAIKYDSGEILFQGLNVGNRDIAFRKYIGYMPENSTPFGFLNAVEYLTFIGKVYEIRNSVLKERIGEFLSIFNLEGERNKLLKNYSKGMKQKILFISSIIHNPPLLILDEPFTGIEPNTAMLMRNIILEMKKKGTGIVFSSHVLEIVEKLADRVVLINGGIVMGQGMMDELKDEGGLETFFSRLTSSGNMDSNTQRIIETINK